VRRHSGWGRDGGAARRRRSGCGRDGGRRTAAQQRLGPGRRPPHGGAAAAEGGTAAANSGAAVAEAGTATDRVATRWSRVRTHISTHFPISIEIALGIDANFE